MVKVLLTKQPFRKRRKRRTLEFKNLEKCRSLKMESRVFIVKIWELVILLFS